LWEVASSGGFYSAGFIPTFAPDKGGWDLAALPDEQRWAMDLNKLLERLPWWEMHPHPEWTSSGQLLAKPGETYLAYNRNGGAVTINLAGYLGTLQAKWINPRDGVTSEEFDVQLGGPALLTPPFTGDWALLIGREIPTDTIPPLPPSGLAMDGHTARTITLKWNASPIAPDGDPAARYLVYRDGAQVGTTAQTWILDTGMEEDTQYAYQVYALDDMANQSETAAEGTFSTSADLTPPVLSEVTPVALDTIWAIFSEVVDSLDAENEDNYKILQGLQVLSAKLSPDGKTVVLRTEQHQEGIYYTLIARQIRDRARHANTLGPNNHKSYRFGSAFAVSNLVPTNYLLDYLHVDDQYYLDRDFTLISIPVDYQDLMWLRTRNDDKLLATDNFISFSMTAPATIYVAYDTGLPSIPSWLSSWTDTNDQIFTTDDMPLRIYEKTFPAGTVTLGANYGDSHSSMYVVLIKPSLSSDIDQPMAPLIVKILNY